MTNVLSFVRIAAGASLCLLVASACGGKSFNNGGDDDDDVTGTSGAAGVGGKKGKPPTGASGNGSTGGYGTGGSVTTGGYGNAGGYAATGGTIGYDDVCSSPPDPGFCDAYIPSWYHDASTGLCRPFVYGGCQGNSNRYDSLAACQKSCPATGMSFDLCKQPSDCILGGTGCCGVCDSPNLSEHDFIAYNEQYANLLQCNIVLDAAPRPAGTAGASSSGAAPNFPIPTCAPCAPVANGTAKYFQPNCVQNRCVVEDVRKTSVTACKTADECKIRYGSGCCEGCGGDVIAVRNDGSYEKLVCGGEPFICPACVPAPGGNGSGATAVCSEGHCQVAYYLK